MPNHPHIPLLKLNHLHHPHILMGQQMAMQHRFAVEVFITGQDGLRFAVFDQQTVAPQGFLVTERVGAGGLEVVGVNVEDMVPARIDGADDPTVGAGLRAVFVFFGLFFGSRSQLQHARLVGIENMAVDLEAYRIARGFVLVRIAGNTAVVAAFRLVTVKGGDLVVFDIVIIDVDIRI